MEKYFMKTTKKNPTIVIKWGVIGGLIGFFIVHPLAMVLAHYMLDRVGQENFTPITVDFLHSFSFTMLPWSLALTLICGLNGYLFWKKKEAWDEKEKLIAKLQNALDEVQTLQGILPICASCKKIRDDKGYWNQIESYITAHSEAKFSHGICQECVKKLYPDLVDENGNI